MCGEEFDLSAQTRQKLRRAAEATGLSLDQYLNKLIDEAIARGELPGEAPENG
jgi:hypothetical protein